MNISWDHCQKHLKTLGTIVVLSAILTTGGCGLIENTPNASREPKVEQTSVPPSPIPTYDKVPISLELLGPVPDFLRNVTFPPIEESKMPSGLYCVLVTEVRKGPTFFELEIGVTTYEEIELLLEPKNVWWDEYYGNLNIEGPKSFPIITIDVCLVGNTIAAIRHNVHRDLPRSLDEILAAYGPPDKVTWGGYEMERSLIWPEQGRLIVVNLEDEFRSETILFSPMAVEELEDSWLMRSILPPEEIPFRMKEDPWGFNDN